LAFIFDTGNFYFCREDPLQNMDALMSRTRHVHLKDWVKSDTPEIADVSGAALGTGLIPNEQIVRKFRSVNPAANLSLEVGAPGDKIKAVQQDLETVRRWLNSA
jgi:sugar phosphate isomerase/epimerase